MKAAVWKGIEHLDIDDLPIPEPKDPYDVQVKVVACGVCATDAHILEGKFPMFKPPRVIGHEFTGVVTAVGKEVTKVKVGDRVAVETGLSCDRCYFCRDGREHQCLHRYAHPGGYAEYACFPDRLIHKLPDGLSFEFGALAEPVACCSPRHRPGQSPLWGCRSGSGGRDDRLHHDAAPSPQRRQ